MMALTGAEQSSLIIKEEVIETSMVQESEELRENQKRLLLSEEIGTEQVPNIMSLNVTDGLSHKEKNIILEIDIVEANENEEIIINEYCRDLNSKLKRNLKISSEDEIPLAELLSPKQKEATTTTKGMEVGIEKTAERITTYK
ncbi:hypothetical protein HHI36_016823 [Cryptolaemus montrouzieri]|uniref:Uncharacterized protein n=1 Tax=Cryptolaemus montrouzieri TaxID=559131 RepID=A0ABD2NKW6_9CUCU